MKTTLIHAADALGLERAATVKMAVVQMVSGPDVPANLAQAASALAQAQAQGAQWVLLPEYFAILAADEQARWQAAEVEGVGPIQTWLAQQARLRQCWLVAGSVPLRGGHPHKTRNSCLVYSPEGGLKARYDKIHLFGFQQGQERYDESASIEAGDEAVVVQTPFGRVALSICYDLRFPELYRALGPIDFLLLPAAFTATTGRAHWEPLLRARAIENQCYVLAAGQGGLHPNGRQTHGHSMIIDPWGQILGQLDQGPGVLCLELSLTQLAQVRANLPALEHRRITV